MYYRHHNLIIFLLIVFIANSAFVSGIATYKGRWTNENAPISELKITEEGGEMYIQVWETTAEGKQDWGKIKAERYDRVSQREMLPTLTATYELADRQVLLVLSSNGKDVEAKVLSFSHQSLQTDHAVYQYHKTKQVSTENIASKSLEAARSHSGQIVGKAMGMARSTASIFHLSLYGPDNPNHVQGTQTFSSEKTYEFSNLPDGTYWLIVDSKAMTGIEAFPAFQEIVIENGKSYVLDVELN
ncbi:MAG: hypothetical protein AAGM67_07470 [Bacteroidota bacterium]